MIDRTKMRLSVSIGVLSFALLTGVETLAATKPVDLDALATNGAESACELNVLDTFPVRVENRVTNRSSGDAFTFAWPSAGPGGFTSSVTPGTAGGVGATWVWTTNQSVFAFTGNSCTNDVCFAQTQGPDSLASFCSDSCLADGTVVGIVKGAVPGTVVLSWAGGQSTFTIYRATSKIGLVAPANAVGSTNTQSFTDTPPAGSTVFYAVRGVDCTTRKACATNADCSGPSDGVCVSRGPFGVPGRSLFSSDVTVSAASLTSSLITFFSPPTEVFRAVSSANAGGASETVTNFSGTPVSVTIEAFPLGCCPANSDVPHQLKCGADCVDYLHDPSNCGACGNVCGDGTCCTNGFCVSVCGEGQTWCDGQCVYLQSDSGHCGSCENSCGEGTCCNDGTCASFCPEGRVLCGDGCVDLNDDPDNCGECGNTCGDGTCCTFGECASLCDEGREWCDGQCADLQDDSANCGECGTLCGAGSCCVEGQCESFCADGQVLCGEQCVDFQNDSANCGGCGEACGEGSCCNLGECVSLCGEGRTWCNGQCVDLYNDSHNCGECGNSCVAEGAAGAVVPCCDAGSCGTFCPPDVPPVGGSCPNPTPTSPTPGYCHNESPASPVAGVCPGLASSFRVLGYCPYPDRSPGAPAGECPGSESPAPIVHEAPLCQINETTQTIPPGGSSTTCRPGGVLFKEVPTAISVCGDGIPGVNGECNSATTKITTGTFNRLTADPRPIGNAYVTPYAVHVVADTSNDGMLEPGESASLVIDLLNAGPMNITQASATLFAPTVDLNADGVYNPVGITVGTASAAYGTILGTAVATNCVAPKPQPASNATVFPVTVPLSHPGDTSPPLILAVTGTVNGGPFAMNVPLTVGVADKCDYYAHTRDYDGLDGLLQMGKLVPEGDPLPPPLKTFNAGSTRQLKLKASCGGINLTDDDVDPPQIIALSEATRGALDIRLLNLNEDNSTNPNDPFFRFNNLLNGGHWKYNMRTSLLGTGSFTLTIRIAGRKNYVTGFVLH